MPVKHVVVIGLVGQQASGKDTVAWLIEEIWGNATYLRAAFSDQIKSDLATGKNVPVSFAYRRRFRKRTPEQVAKRLRRRGYNPKCKTERSRKILDEYGAYMRNKYTPHYWLNRLESFCRNELKKVRPVNGTVVLCISDVRMPLEADFVKIHPPFVDARESCFLIRVEAPREIRLERASESPEHGGLFAEDDITETAQAGIETDFTINNKGDIDNLRRQTHHLIDTICRGCHLPQPR